MKHRHRHHLIAILSIAVFIPFHLSDATRNHHKSHYHHQHHHPHHHLEDGVEPYTDHLTPASAQDGGLSVDIVSRLEEVRDHGIEWLFSQATGEYGWPAGDTAKVVVALASSVEDWPAKNDFVAKLIIKQLEVELLEKLLRTETDSFTPEQVALFALGLRAACRDPHNFLGHNVVASLEKHHSVQDFPGHPETYGYSFTSLVSCLVGSHLHKKRIRHLLQIAKEHSTLTPFLIDVQGVTLMALECIRHRRKGEFVSHHIHEPLQAIASQQTDDGSFGSILTTSIAIQTLAVSGDPALSWNKTAAALALINFQQPNGSFLNSVELTAESVVGATALLNGLGIMRLRVEHCRNGSSIRKRKGPLLLLPPSNASRYVTDEIFHHNLQQEYSSHYLNSDHQINAINATALPLSPPLSVQSQPKGQDGGYSSSFFRNDDDDYDSDDIAPNSSIMVSVKYWMWVGSVASNSTKYNLTLQVPLNATFFYVMNRAAELSKEYQFTSVVWPNGHYIQTLAGQKEQPSGYIWLLYLLSDDPNPENPPSPSLIAPTGVDELLVCQGQVYLFWYKKI